MLNAVYDYLTKPKYREVCELYIDGIKFDFQEYCSYDVELMEKEKLIKLTNDCEKEIKFLNFYAIKDITFRKLN